jgi:ABC-type dipeptide/oligopeptide/nickel transport system permease component
LIKRLGSGALAIVGVSILTFAFLHVVPGDPIDHLAGGEATPETRAKLEACLGLDQEIPQQLITFLGHLVDGTLGHQCPDPETKPTVAARIFAVLPHTLALALAGMVLAAIVAIPLGVLAAIKRGTWIDTAVTVGSLAGIAVPMMVLASLLVLVFSADLAWLPGPTELGPAALILPAITVGAHLMAMLARMTRGAMLEVLGEDFIRTLRAKGVPEVRVLFVHALRNALLPVITVAGLQFGSLLSGAIIVEKVFARPGVGTTLLDAITERDYPVVQGTVLVIAVTYVLVNIAVDVAYGVIDPRIRVS